MKTVTGRVVKTEFVQTVESAINELSDELYKGKPL